MVSTIRKEGWYKITGIALRGNFNHFLKVDPMLCSIFLEADEEMWGMST